MSLEKERQDQEMARHFAWCTDQLRRGIVVEDASPTNIARQMGKPMSPEKLEGIIAKLNPSIKWRVNPFVPSKKALYIVENGVEEFICAYENAVMPEYSLFGVMTEKGYNPDLFGEHRSQFTRDMMAESKATPVSFSKLEDMARDKGMEAVENYIADREKDTAEIGVTETKKLGREILRGWRTVLAILATAFLVSPTLVEQYVDASERESWNAHVKRNTSSPF